MKKGNPPFLVLSGDGINCERETAWALEAAGAVAKIMHVNELLQNKKKLFEFRGLALPGGFSFGDELGSGRVLALKMKLALQEVLQRFLEGPHPVIGICNGFQVLMHLGVFGARPMSLTANESGEFLNTWVSLEVDPASPCVWTKKLQGPLELPIRHGEGRIMFSPGQEEEIYQSLELKKQIPLKYSKNMNGSYENIAGLCDERGLIFGLMPHPEAALFQILYPHHGQDRWEKGVGVQFFEGAVEFLKKY